MVVCNLITMHGNSALRGVSYYSVVIYLAQEKGYGLHSCYNIELFFICFFNGVHGSSTRKKEIIHYYGNTWSMS